MKGVGQGRRRRVLVESYSRTDLKCVVCGPLSIVRRPSSVVRCMLPLPIQFPRKYFSTSHEYFVLYVR
jgi:hypothetical protein